MEVAKQMTANKQNLSVSGLNSKGPTPFEVHPNAAQRKAIAKTLDLVELRKIRFVGEIKPSGDADWALTGELGATVVQPCVVTLAPVSSRIDIKVSRLFVDQPPVFDDTEEEIEVLQGDDSEPLGSHIKLEDVMSEALSLALPLYPKTEGANLETSTFTEDGKAPMSDEDARPFAALSALRDKLETDE